MSHSVCAGSSEQHVVTGVQQVGSRCLIQVMLQTWGQTLGLVMQRVPSLKHMLFYSRLINEAGRGFRPDLAPGCLYVDPGNKVFNPEPYGREPKYPDHWTIMPFSEAKKQLLNNVIHLGNMRKNTAVLYKSLIFAVLF